MSAPVIVLDVVVGIACVAFVIKLMIESFIVRYLVIVAAMSVIGTALGFGLLYLNGAFR